MKKTGKALQKPNILSATKKTIGKSVRRDGWTNVLTGLGQVQFDKLANSSIDYQPMDDATAENLYGASDLAAKICDELPQEALREGYDLTFEKSAKFKKGIESEDTRLQVCERFLEAWVWARIYGGAGIVMVPQNLSVIGKPMDPNNPERITNLLVLSKWELLRRQIDADIRWGNFGKPSLYNVQPRGADSEGGILFQVHYSRVIRFEGVPLPRRMFIENNYWGDSILNRIQNVIRNYDISHDAAALALQDFSVAVWKLKDLARMIQENGDTDVITRMQLLNLTRSIARCIVLDADEESYEYQTRTFAGVGEIIEKLSNRLVAGADHMPHTKLLGESPSGLGATGNSEERNWYDYVASRQMNYLRPRLIQFYKTVLAFKKGPTKGQVPDDLAITFKPLWQMDEKEEADSHFTQAQSDQVYVQNGVLDPLEVRSSRFGKGKYSYETELADKEPDVISEEPLDEGDVEPSTEAGIGLLNLDPDPAPFQVPEAKASTKAKSKKVAKWTNK